MSAEDDTSSVHFVCHDCPREFVEDEATAQNLSALHQQVAGHRVELSEVDAE